MRSVSDWFNSGHLKINFSHPWILSLYIFFFALNDRHWCKIFSLDVAVSTLTSQYSIFFLNGIFDLEDAFYKFNFDLGVTVSTLMSQCCVFHFHVAFSNLIPEFWTRVRLRELIWGTVAEIICVRSVSDWFNSGHLQISFSHLWILSLYYFSLHWMIHNDVTFSLLTVRFLPWCHSVAFSTLMVFSILKLHFISLFLTLMSQCCVFYFHAAFSNLMTFSKSMLHFLPWYHSFAFFTLIRRYSTLMAFSTVNLNCMIRLKCSSVRKFSLAKWLEQQY